MIQRAWRERERMIDRMIECENNFRVSSWCSGCMYRLTIMWCDSKSAVEMAFDPVAFKKTKHILRAAQFLRDQVARDVVTLRHARGAIMIADILTKGVARPLFLELLRLLDNYAALASADAIPEPNSSRSDAVSAPDTSAARRG